MFIPHLLSYRTLLRSALISASLLLPLGLVVSCGSPSNLPSAIDVSTKVATTSEGSLEDRIYQGISAYRSHRGLPKQPRHYGLDQLAAEHARDMLAAGKLEHVNYEYREGLAIQRYQVGGLEENILRAFRVTKDQMAATAVKGWIESRGHRMNLETTNTHIGIGVAIGADGALYAVHLTGTPMRKSAYHDGLPRGYSNSESEYELAW